MTIDPNHEAPNQDNLSDHWQAAITQQEAERIGWSKNRYMLILVHATQVAKDHFRAGTPRDQWEPRGVHNEAMGGPYLDDAGQALRDDLESVDVDLDAVQDSGREAGERLDQADEILQQQLVDPETNATHTVDGAVEFLNAGAQKIARAFRRGDWHHKRLPAWTPWLVAFFLLLEVGGLAAVVAYFLDVNLFAPLEDILAFTLAATIVTVLIGGQWFLMHRAGVRHNEYREARAENEVIPADHARQRRNLFLGLATPLMAVITAGLIYRSIAAVGSRDLRVLLLLIGMALVVGVAMPLITFLVRALDGSTLSRGMDGLLTQIEDNLDAYLQALENAGPHIAAMNTGLTVVRTQSLPAALDQAQDIVNGVLADHADVRLLIGGLSADPPVRKGRGAQINDEGNLTGEVTTGLPGMPDLDMTPVVDRLIFRKELRIQATELEKRRAAARKHPWTNDHRVRAVLRGAIDPEPQVRRTP